MGLMIRMGFFPPTGAGFRNHPRSRPIPAAKQLGKNGRALSLEGNGGATRSQARLGW